jgi:DnaD/phage-associated family protein
MSKFLLDDKPLIILPSLAETVGLNESIVLQQLHYWLKESSHIYDGYKWIYNTYSNWKEQFPFWSDKTIRRIITKLENQGLIVTGNYNKLGIDKTKWYRIDYEKLEILTSPSGQNDQMDGTDCPVEAVNLTTPLPEITTENTTEKKEGEEEAPSPDPNPFQFFEENGFGVIGGYIAEKIGQWCDDLSPELVLEAMKIAVEYGAKNWNYVERILRNWADKKLTTVEQVHAALLEFRERKAKQRDNPKYPNKQKRTEIVPDWWDDNPRQTKQPESIQEIGEQKKEDETQLKKQSIQEKLKKFRMGDANGST